MHTNTRWSRQSWRDWDDRIDDPGQAQTKFDVDAWVDEVLDFAREMAECAMAPLRDLIAHPPPAFSRRSRAWGTRRAPCGDD